VGGSPTPRLPPTCSSYLTLEARNINSVFLYVPKKEGVYAVDRRLPVLPGPKPIHEKILDGDNAQAMALELDPRRFLVWIKGLPGELNKYLLGLEDPMAALTFEPSLLERLRGAWRDRTHQIYISGRIGTPRIKLDSCASHHHRRGFLVIKKTLKPSHQRCSTGRSFIQREDLFEIHKYNL